MTMDILKQSIVMLLAWFLIDGACLKFVMYLEKTNSLKALAGLCEILLLILCLFLAYKFSSWVIY